ALFFLKDCRAAWLAWWWRPWSFAPDDRRHWPVPLAQPLAPCGRARCSRPSIGAGKPDEQEPVGAAARRRRWPDKEMRMMKRVVVDHFGGPEVLRVVEEDDPRPGPGEVRVRVLAAGVSYTD